MSGAREVALVQALHRVNKGLLEVHRHDPRYPDDFICIGCSRTWPCYEARVADFAMTSVEESEPQ